ncbi:MAG: hypothetical protein OXH85_05400 [Truepera sp.]|nr:hypothetical protein [Truepera sp.]
MSEEGVYPEEIGDPRTRWSALAHVELADHPEALARVLETMASYEPPEYPGPTGCLKRRTSPRQSTQGVHLGSWSC